MSEDTTRDFGENEVMSRNRQKRVEWRSRIKQAISEGNILISEGNYRDLIRLMRDHLYRDIVLSDRTESLEDYHMELYDDEEREWYWTPIHLFAENHEEYLNTVEQGSEEDPISKFLTKKEGGTPETEEAREFPKKAFRSLESIAEIEGIVDSDLRSRVPAFGWNHKIGVHRQSYDMDLGESVNVKSNETGENRVLFAGMPGQGKSQGKKASLEDDYQFGKKIIDLVDMDKYENGTYDVPQSDEEMREIRKEKDMAPDFTEEESFKNHQFEIYLPLTEKEKDLEIPVKDNGESIVNWFTIPASTISESVFTSTIRELLSDQDSKDVTTIYNTVDNKFDDWTLSDMADEVRRRDLEEKSKERILYALKSLQSEGFIRDKSCPHALDIDEIFLDVDTITSISQAPISSQSSRLFLVAYLLDLILTETKKKSYPKRSIVLSELHEIVPHNRMTASNPLAEVMQKGPVRDAVKTFMLKGRHYGSAVYADTQRPNHINVNIKEEFNKYVIYTMGSKRLKNVFEYADAVDSGSYKGCDSTLSMETGVAAIVGVTEPTVEKREIDYISPVYYLPPSHHHVDTDKRRTGFEARVDLLGESLEAPSVDTTLPEEYKISESTEPEEYDPQDNPVGAFVEVCLEESDSPQDYVQTSTVRNAYAEYAKQNDLPEYDKDALGRKLKQYINVERKKKSVGYAYEPLKLSDEGLRLVG